MAVKVPSNTKYLFFIYLFRMFAIRSEAVATKAKLKMVDANPIDIPNPTAEKT